jgi:hypothetical protein
MYYFRYYLEIFLEEIRKITKILGHSCGGSRQASQLSIFWKQMTVVQFTLTFSVRTCGWEDNIKTNINLAQGKVK